MPSAPKRSLPETDGHGSALPKEPSSMLHRIRNMWQFANLYQFILLFGKAVKLDESLDIEDLEAECLKPYSTRLQDIGLSLLKYLSSHRGLTHELFDEYTRRQFQAKAPEKNPFGDDEAPLRFADFDVFAKLRILHQMTVFVMLNPEKLRERTEEQKDVDQTNWRIEPYGWDRHDRTYFVLDDNRLYRRTDAPLLPPKPRTTSKKLRASTKAHKRRRTSASVNSGEDDRGDAVTEVESATVLEDDDFGGMKWQCMAVTLEEVRTFLDTIMKTKDENEKVLRDQIQGHLMPILEKQEESRQRKILQREKELLNLEKMAHAKRSSRIASKMDHQKHMDQMYQEERKRHEEEATAKKGEQKRLKMERERDNRLMAREKRLKEREVRRLLHEEELAQLSEDSKSVGDGVTGRLSGRRLQAEIEKKKQVLREIEELEDDWIFDCICGVYGQVDDGTHSVSCENCNVWQHSKCLKIKEEDAEHDNFHFICNTCKRRAAEAKSSHPRKIKIKVKDKASPPQGKERNSAQLVVELPSKSDTSTKATPSVGHFKTWNGGPSNPFSSPHPTLSPPDQSSTQSKVYMTIYANPSPAPNAASLDGKACQSHAPPRKKAIPAHALPKAALNSAPPPATATKLSPVAVGQSVSSWENRSKRDDSSPLPPIRGGLSPTKHSPPVQQHHAYGPNGVSGAHGIVPQTPSILPPATALSPSPAQTILTPPVKPTASAAAPASSNFR